MRRLDLALLFFAGCALCLAFCAATSASAQGLKITQPPPDCHLFREAWDNPYDDTHSYRQPRIAWHAEYSALSLGVGYGLHRFLHLPAWLAATTATLAIGVAPHIRGGIIKRSYPINPLDWTFDLWSRATPAFWAAARSHDDTTGIHWKAHAISAGTWALGYGALACFASP